MRKRILIAAGGTGGHVFPGLAIADEFAQRGHEVEWLGTKVGLEARLVPVHGIKLNFFKVKGIRGKGLKGVLSASFRVVFSVIQAWRQLKKIKPDLVIGMGGFVAGPAGFAAFLQHRPLAIHEQNAIPGTTNQLLSRLAKITMCAFPVPLKNAEVIGNPVRASLERIQKNYLTEKAVLNVLVLGGSRGARALNLGLAAAFLQAGVEHKIKVKHQCGTGREQETLDAYKETEIDVDVRSFIDDMDEAMNWADLMICRSGALTVSEIAVVGIPSILIPYPYAISDHQTHNAKYLVTHGAAKVVQEREFGGGKLVAAIRNIVTNQQELRSMSAAALGVAKRGAASKFVDRCEELLL